MTHPRHSTGHRTPSQEGSYDDNYSKKQNFTFGGLVKKLGMKRLLLLVAVLLTACAHTLTKQQIAEHIVKNYLHATLDEPGSYKNKGFDFLTTVYQVTKPGFAKRDTFEIYTSNAGDKSTRDSSVIGYKIIAAYSFKDKAGEKHLWTGAFWIDKTLSKVYRFDRTNPR